MATWHWKDVPPAQLKFIHETIRDIPELQSVLYDLNLLPEVLVTLNQGVDSKEFFYMMSVILHFDAIVKRLQPKGNNDGTETNTSVAG